MKKLIDSQNLNVNNRLCIVCVDSFNVIVNISANSETFGLLKLLRPAR